MHGNRIQIALAQDIPPRLGFFCKVEGKQRAALLVHQRLGAVHIFAAGLLRVQLAAAESNNVAPQVKNRDHNAVAEKIESAALFTAFDEARCQKLVLRIAQAFQMIPRLSEAVRRVSQAEALDGRVGKAAPAPVRPSDAPGVRIQTRKIEARRVLVDGDDPAAQAAGLVILLRKRHTGASRKEFDGLYVINIVYFFDKGDDVAARAAAKAVKRLRLGIYDKGRRFFIVKRAQPGMGAAAVPQLYIALHHVHDIAALHQFCDIIARDHPAAPFRYLLRRAGAIALIFHVFAAMTRVR